MITWNNKEENRSWSTLLSQHFSWSCWKILGITSLMIADLWTETRIRDVLNIEQIPNYLTITNFMNDE